MSVTLLANNDTTIVNGLPLIINTTTQSSNLPIPNWIEEYFEWHRSSLSRLNHNHSAWTSYKYLVVRCLHMDHKCGGAADRLKSIPLILLIASKHQRLLFIEWEKPYPLSEFLSPVEIDWRIPRWMRTSSSKGGKHNNNNIPGFVFQRSPSIVSVKHLSRFDSHSNDTLLDMRFQSTDHGKSAYNTDQHGKLTFDEVYPVVWSKIFRPSRGVEAQLEEARRSIRLLSQKQPAGSYASLHIRSKYYKDKSDDKSAVQNAIRCVAPHSNVIFMASDSTAVVDTAKQIVATEWPNHIFLTTMTKNQPPLHLDRGSDYLLQHNSSQQPSSRHRPGVSEYYSIFVDLYLMSEGRCVAYNVGGYGHWASLIANPVRPDACHHFNHRRTTC